MKGILILFGILLGVGALGFLCWFVYWRRKEKPKNLSQKDAKRILSNEIRKISGPQTVLADYRTTKNGFIVYVEFLVVNAYGVFVISSVRNDGYISGTATDKEWIATKKDGTAEAFFNPVLQNASHVQTVRGMIPSDVPVRSVVVILSGEAENICKSVTEAVTLKQLKNVLTSGQKRLKRSEIDKIANFLCSD